MDARTSRYHEVYARAQRDPQGFWGEAAQAIDWYEAPRTIFDPKAGIYGRWFTDGVCNTCHNAIDRHVTAGRGAQTAIVYDSPVTNTKRRISYAELLDEVKAFAAVLRDFGVGKGDRVILYMPMVPETLVAMYACARIGAIHGVVFGGFAAKELATRIDDAKPKLILSASCGIEPGRVVAYKPLLDAAIALAAHKAEACIILQRPQLEAPLTAGRDHDWATLREQAIAQKKSADCVPMLATDPLYILYTSGTTGIPKGVVRDNGGHLVALKWSMHGLYGVEPGETWWCASDVGWVVGPLLHRLRAAVSRRDFDPLRGQAGRHARRRRVLARDRGPRRGRAVHRADGVPRHQERGPAGRAHPQARPVEIPHACSWPASAPTRRPSHGPSSS